MSLHDDYAGFLAKFEPKRTTDDCYTPPHVYEAVLGWACREYGLSPSDAVRPFYPGGDFEAEDYPEGCVVIDNPPFSILTKIVRHYNERGVRYFLFAPGLTTILSAECCAVCADCDIVYDNGANVRTNFVTNLDQARARTAPGLYQAVKAAMETAKAPNELPKYVYPPEVATAAMLNRYSHYGIDFRVMPGECERITALDEQREAGKGIFGSGLLLSERAAAERAAAERAAAERAAAERAAAQTWTLSERERTRVRALG
ncbi:hypothetical protein [Enterorhabdus sp. P55]|uniref:hypothetical protein n=1 Tax=Enterorhabdus sp. P55 TaxID=2304571 RepID=UPI00136A65D7|nr:hypothetical protein [Enterorhabdus sp. P55]NBI32619.1 hypothetical protein [Enterorhabdus sp. P55]